jgi:hypothetical protein
MNKQNRLYIERKTRGGKSLNDKGPATIATVTYSKTGKTIYYKNLELKRPSSNMTSCIYGNYYDVKTGDEFWVSGIKKRGSNRYPWAEKVKVAEEGELS